MKYIVLSCLLITFQNLRFKIHLTIHLNDRIKYDHNTYQRNLIIQTRNLSYYIFMKSHYLKISLTIIEKLSKFLLRSKFKVMFL